ncbi:MAG: DinB family protein [Ginsengibacter sp.]
MEIKNRSAVSTIADQYDWHTKLFMNVLDGIADKDTENRLGTKANHIAWLAGSLVQGRFVLAKFLDIDATQTSDQLFKDNKGIQDNTPYPSLDEYRKDWDRISQTVKEALINAKEDRLNSPDPFNMPGGDYTFFDTIVACTDRESYCIGQIGLWRRLLGYEPMKYM